MCSSAQTQYEMNLAAQIAYEKSDEQLNKVYQQIRSEYEQDSLFIENLKISQRLWIKFRDAELNMKYPEYQSSYYGSILPLCKSEFLKQLTDERIKTLQVWLDGIPEGDLCIGSVKLN